MVISDAPPCAAALRAFNALPQPAAEEHLLTLCGSRRWAAALSARRPFADEHALEHDACNLWFLLGESDWLEAFACHPRIGEQPRGASAFSLHAAAEQQAAQQTLSEATAHALAEGNRQYEQRFGFVYIIFASGRTAPELLALLERRLQNDRITELHEAARQQHSITTLRLRRWLEV